MQTLDLVGQGASVVKVDDAGGAGSTLGTGSVDEITSRALEALA